jgi:abortive infection bacteriophage resistance protein
MNKPFRTTTEQIEILKGRGLLFDSEEDASHSLRRSGYYEVINGYKDPFMKNPTDDDAGFIEGTRFAQIYQLYALDTNLRNELMNALEEFESNLRQVIAYVVSEAISDDFKVYVDRRQYRTGSKQWNPRKHKKTYL